jgi:alkanesulfonate monooxygenase SsuD/methylene tetrahydromethanopterin reductase-like flavin-dependent oxidoreductase (luciferase family)
MDNFAIMREIWEHEAVDWDTAPFNFSGATIQPHPTGRIPLWYCGNTPKSARLAARNCDGWLPGRIGIDTLRVRVATIEEISSEVGRPRPNVGIIPTTSLGRTQEEALAEVNVDGLLKWANNAKFWSKPSSGQFESVGDLGGVLLYGTPDDIVEQCHDLRDSGVDEVVFDFRLTFPRWEEQIQRLGEEVLPLLGD